MKQTALDNAFQLTSDLWQIKDLLDPAELDEILYRISVEEQWHHQELQSHLNRKTVAWHTDGLLEWTWIKLNDLDFSRFDLKFRTVMIWRDQQGFTISNHCDNERVVAAMQIYLSPTRTNLGTWFADNIEIPFVQNTGYLMHNRNKLIHGMRAAVPQDYTRISFYALFDSVS